MEQLHLPEEQLMGVLHGVLLHSGLRSAAGLCARAARALAGQEPGAGSRRAVSSQPGAGRCMGEPTHLFPENVVDRHLVQWLSGFRMIALLQGTYIFIPINMCNLNGCAWHSVRKHGT